MKYAISSLLILSVLLITITTGCSNSAKSDTQNKITSESQETTETTTDENNEETFIEPEIPDKKYNGQQFNIIYPEWGAFENYLFSEELTGEIINDTVFKRNSAVEERLDIVIEGYSPGYIQDIYPAVNSAVMAGDSSYDLIMTHCIQDIHAMIKSNIIKDWNKIPNVDFSKPYWNQSMNDTLEVMGKLPVAASDYVIPDPNCIPFNKNMIDDYGLENPYDLVKNGTWTWDKLGEMASKVSVDLDGDSKFTNADQYGFACEVDWMLASVISSCDQPFVDFNSEGMPEVALGNEKTADIISMIYSLLCENNTSFTFGYDQMKDEKLGLPFDSGRVLFYMRDVKSLTDYREMEDEFGVLPFPKYDENQEQYLSLNWSGLMCVPAVVNDTELVGSAAELLSAETRRSLIPAYFDVLLEGKIARDNDSKEMLRLIFDNCVYDFGLNYSNFSQSLYIVSNMIKAKSTDTASFLAKITKSENKIYQKLYEYFEEFDAE